MVLSSHIVYLTTTIFHHLTSEHWVFGIIIFCPLSFLGSFFSFLAAEIPGDDLFSLCACHSCFFLRFSCVMRSCRRLVYLLLFSTCLHFPFLLSFFFGKWMAQDARVKWWFHFYFHLFRGFWCLLFKFITKEVGWSVG